MNQSLGDRMKEYEAIEAQRRLMPLLPVCARIDGTCFSKFTRGLARPYDERLSSLMIETTIALVEEMSARLGYTQSDEISLFWYVDNTKSQLPYDGRIQKLVGELAAQATLIFNEALSRWIPEKADYKPYPRFDARVWNVPTLAEAANVFLWRELDATKNSVSMAAHHYYSHNELMNKSGSKMQEMLFQKGVNWNDYPAFFKRGMFVQRQLVRRRFTVAEIDKLPEKHQVRSDPDLMIDRQMVSQRPDMPPFGKVVNRVDFLLGKNPEIVSEKQDT